MKRLPAWLVLAVGLLAPLAAIPTARAELPSLIPREVLFGNPERANPQLSPDGTKLAYLKADDKNVLQVWVKTIGKDDDAAITKDKKRGITQFFWAWDNQHILYIQDNDGDENFHLYASNLASRETRDLTPYPGVRAIPVATEPETPDRGIVLLNRRNKALFDPHLVNLTTGEVTLVAENPGDVTGWLVDTNLDVRAAQATKPDGSGELRVRDTKDAPWRTIATWTYNDEFNALEFSKDGKTIYVQTNKDADTRGLYALDPASGKLTLIASDPRSDAAQTVIHPRTRTVQAVSFNRDRPQWKILDPTVAKDYAAIAKAAPGDFRVMSRDLADETWLVGYTNDTSSPKYYTWKRGAQKAELLFSAQPRLDDYVLAPMKPVEIKTRDGLSLPSYLTLPVGVPATKLPMVLFVHGGPWSRDSWGYSSTPQWLANRGYAVLQVNYRGSTGFGKAFKNAAMKQFAGKMHDDLVDAVKWAIAEGIADPKKIGIMGGSYGGYATLVGLTFTPELFAAGVDIVGPSNLVSLVESFPPYWGPSLAANWYPFVGNPKDPKDRADMEARSPLFKVDKIRAPLLIGQGANDPRVTKKESDQIVEALKKNGRDVEYIVFADEGHGFARPENRLKFNAAAEAFLSKHLGGRSEPAVAGPVELEAATTK